VNDLTGESLIKSPDDPDYLVRHAVVEKDVPDCLSVDAIKGLLKVHEANVERSLPFYGLLHNDS